jgi:two-component system, NarL family, response regulator YdfI
VTRVLVIAESPVIRAGLEAILAEDGRFAVISTHRGAAPHDADLVIAFVESDGSLPRSAADVPPDVPWLVLASELPPGLRASVRAALPLDASGPEITAAAAAVAEGLLVFHPALYRPLSVARDRFGEGSASEDLSPREIEVLRLLAEGAGNKQIAYRLGISDHTVKFHVSSVLAKLGVTSRTEAVSVGIRQGLILL